VRVEGKVVCGDLVGPKGDESGLGVVVRMSSTWIDANALGIVGLALVGKYAETVGEVRFERLFDL
jgi:hypothetical protein